MRRLTVLASAILVCGSALAGCSGKDEKSSETPNAPAVDNAMKSSTAAQPNKMAAGSSDAVKDKVDAALKADTKLAGAAITVDHKDGKVVLKGQVADNAAKKQAGEDADKAVKDAGGADTIQNMLTVKSH